MRQRGAAVGAGNVVSLWQLLGVGQCQWYAHQSSPTKHDPHDCDPVDTQKMNPKASFIYTLSSEGKTRSYILVSFPWSLRRSKAKETMRESSLKEAGMPVQRFLTLWERVAFLLNQRPVMLGSRRTRLLSDDVSLSASC